MLEVDTRKEALKKRGMHMSIAKTEYVRLN